MLYADKRALETNLKVELLEIREKELNFYTNNCQNIGTQAAMLAGFAFAGMMQPLPDQPEAHAPPPPHSFYPCGRRPASPPAHRLVTVVTTTLLSMLSPGLALRGPDGSMHTAVDGMVDEYRLSFYTFMLGLIATHFAAAFFVLVFLWWQAAVLSFCIFFSLAMLYRMTRVLMLKFAMPKGELQTGKFEAAEGAAAGAQAGVVDAGEISTLSALILQEQRLAAAAQAQPARQPARQCGRCTERAGAGKRGHRDDGGQRRLRQVGAGRDRRLAARAHHPREWCVVRYAGRACRRIHSRVLRGRPCSSPLPSRCCMRARL
ncbi:hypothetical protein EMIHUDRAFT_462903 [Emiliania huxleyi CCMP1516]|uniref:ABC transmembrane type-1 domain-containing protein n=2 Tax=Emiliania huxleyi TaxID=2903 RepID=A0A0D3K2N3_EMIH1|nr:hypothetical protein EMIHUDRAFT_462903 [Emiliania huxleyi CCMP1516]EOD30018.1 hypothetical protein EMIHUDRAFT_462903 [Emiliania huxleyi CCMP1516]|eukprot:XP_005782447.1 hypothetical protein EMIHUDRAFT_462903 [Emiliania huxleyi CCMP1516]